MVLSTSAAKHESDLRKSNPLGTPNNVLDNACADYIIDALKAHSIIIPRLNINKVVWNDPNDYRYNIYRGTLMTISIKNTIEAHIPAIKVLNVSAVIVVVQLTDTAINEIQSLVGATYQVAQSQGEIPMPDEQPPNEPVSSTHESPTETEPVVGEGLRPSRFEVKQPVWYDGNQYHHGEKQPALPAVIWKIGKQKINIHLESGNPLQNMWVFPKSLSPRAEESSEPVGTRHASSVPPVDVDFDETQPDPDDWRSYEYEEAYRDAVARQSMIDAYNSDSLPVGTRHASSVPFSLLQAVVANHDIDTPEGIKNIYHGDDGIITNLDPLTVKFTVLNHGDWQQIEVTVKPTDIRPYGKQFTFPGLDIAAITAAKMVNNYKYLTGTIESLQTPPNQALVDELNRTRLDLQRTQIALDDARKKSAITPLNEFTLLRQENEQLRAALAERPPVGTQPAASAPDQPKQYDVRVVPEIDERTLQGFINTGWEIISTGWTPVITDGGYTRKPAFNVTVRREQCPPPGLLTAEEVANELFAAVDTTAQLQHIIEQEPALQEMFALSDDSPRPEGEGPGVRVEAGGEVESSPLLTAYKHGQQKPDPNDPSYIEAVNRAREKLFGKRRAGYLTYGPRAKAQRAAATIDERATDELPVVPPPCEAGRGLGGGDISIVDTTPPSLTDLVSTLPIAATIAQVGAENTAAHLINSALQAGVQAAQQHAQLNPLRSLTQLKETN